MDREMDFAMDEIMAADSRHVPDAPPIVSTVADQKLQFTTICLRKFAKLKLPPRKTVLAPILPQKGLAMLFAGRGIGKTHVALGIAYAVSCGGEFLRWRADKARKVLYVDGEMPQQALQERLAAIMAASEWQPEEDTFRLLCMDRQELGASINLSNPKHQEVIDEHLDDDVELLVLDNMSTLMNGGPENDAESWISMQAWLLQLRRRGVTVLIVHHASRNGNARGTSKREDVLDTVIQLKHPEDYDPSDGARFEVHLTKARGLHGDEAAAFEAKLEVDEEGRANWVCKDLVEDDEVTTDMVEALRLSREEDLSLREIGLRLKVNHMKVQRMLKKAVRLEKQGKLKLETEGE
jgi:putative DNA primase/helicase